MSEYRLIRKVADDAIVLARAQWCASYFCKMKGLQFARNLPEDAGLLFVNSNESVVGASIHMFFMFMEIGVVWLDEDGVIVDQKLAKPWRPAYAPSFPAQYYIEARPSILGRVAVGDRLQFHEVVS